MPNKKTIHFLFHLIIMFILFLSLIFVTFAFGGKLFLGELLLILFFLLLALISMAGFFLEEWTLPLLFFYALNLINFLFLHYLLREIFFLPLITTIIGFFITLIYQKEIPEAIPVETYEEKPKEIPKEEIKKEFIPGKYIASSAGNKYHSPKCDWAKRIRKPRQIWFDDKKSAQKAHYKPCACVK